MDRGHENFIFECLDINQNMLDRSQKLAAEAGVGEKVIPLRGDFNNWSPAHEYDGVIANQSLHHVSELEHLFDAIKEALGPHGRFITSDIIGRNGHQRWPEAVPIIQEFWQELPDEYRFNQILQRPEKKIKTSENLYRWNFEGIRAQDILFLSVERFHFDFFAGFANIIDPFIDRSFGHHFDVNSAWDREFIDRVHARDEAEILSGRITPTHMLAVMCSHGPGERCFVDGLSPEQCIRKI
jgi:SAM-dependent methyltransferase